MFYNLIASTEESTVVSEYVREARPAYGAYQSEAELEEALLRLLQQEGYTYLDIRSEAELIANLRAQLEALNDYAFRAHNVHEEDICAVRLLCVACLFRRFPLK